ncbi:hypothetical protein P691DRAFT_806573 [Macrolepiota fuliginosa MF-IS2]|uniref:Uncharacterized protein n=1 Tax=Macrolepiota fuliginosa MF-IS2 TaxID=1400762 RepID=A0A9P5X5D7_9AGAR|nr:hypothetical protein P691DRAFT_806573 [Macrolepiota fuliginosa MF-IS2]
MPEIVGIIRFRGAVGPKGSPNQDFRFPLFPRLTWSSPSLLLAQDNIAYNISSSMNVVQREKDHGLVVLPPYKSSVTGQEIRYSTLAGQYATHSQIQAHQPLMLHPIPPFQPPQLSQALTSTPWSPPPAAAAPRFNGIMEFEGPQMEVSSSQNMNARREFPAETYAQVKRHVKYMVEHPYEQTLKYKISRIRDISRGFFMRVKWWLIRRGRVISTRVRRSSIEPLGMIVEKCST